MIHICPAAIGGTIGGGGGEAIGAMEAQIVNPPRVTDASERHDIVVPGVISWLIGPALPEKRVPEMVM